MHEALTKIRDRLDGLGRQIRATIPNDEPLSILFGGWNIPGLTRNDLDHEIRRLIDDIEERGNEDFNEAVVQLLIDYER